MSTPTSTYSVVTSSEAGVLKALRHKGYAVVIFDPEELQGAEPRAVEDALVTGAWVIIDELKEDKLAQFSSPSEWLSNFTAEFMRRVGITWNDAGYTELEAFDLYPQDVSEAVSHYIWKHDLTDITL